MKPSNSPAGEDQKERAAALVAALEQRYPEAVCALRYEGEPWKLLVMARLSAQCTDARVNLVSQTLFRRWPTLEALAGADLAELSEAVRPCGLYRVKAQNIRDACQMICEQYGGVLPSDMDQLLALPGVGRKIANLLRGDLFGLPAIVADTHCIRLSGRFGFCDPEEKDPVRVEKALTALIEPEKQSDFCHRLVMFGREVCTARHPQCDLCPADCRKLCRYRNAAKI